MNRVEAGALSIGEIGDQAEGHGVVRVEIEVVIGIQVGAPESHGQEIQSALRAIGCCASCAKTLGIGKEPEPRYRSLRQGEPRARIRLMEEA